MLAGDAYQYRDPELIRASHRIRAVTNQLIGGPPDVPTPHTHWHSPSTSAKPAPPSRTHSRTEPTGEIRPRHNESFKIDDPGPARHLANRAVTLAGDNIAWVDPRALNRNHLITLPGRCENTSAPPVTKSPLHTSQALAGSAILDPVRQPAATHIETPDPAGRPPTTVPSHKAIPGTVPGAVTRHADPDVPCVSRFSCRLAFRQTPSRAPSPQSSAPAHDRRGRPSAPVASRLGALSERVPENGVSGVDRLWPRPRAKRARLSAGSRESHPRANLPARRHTAVRSRSTPLVGETPSRHKVRVK